MGVMKGNSALANMLLPACSTVNRCRCQDQSSCAEDCISISLSFDLSLYLIFSSLRAIFQDLSHRSYPSIFILSFEKGLPNRDCCVQVRNIVNTGRTIVCTIHQPSIDIFEVKRMLNWAISTLSSDDARLLTCSCFQFAVQTRMCALSHMPF